MSSRAPKPFQKYPLDALRDHRTRQVDDATAALGAAVRDVHGAACEREAAERAEKDAAAEAGETRAREAARLALGELRAVDLARAAGWEVSARAEANALGQATAAASAKLSVARDAEADARASLLQTKANRDVVTSHEAEFILAGRRAADVAEEEAQEENWAGKSRGR